MKSGILAILCLTVLCSFFYCRPLQAQSESDAVSYLSYGYFDGLILADSLLIQDTVVITVSHNKIEMFKVDVLDTDKIEPFFESRSFSPSKYPDNNGGHYTVWKLGDRKMILRTVDGRKYISLYQTDAYGLPKQYLTYKIEE
jgi:hypothetical protein